VARVQDGPSFFGRGFPRDPIPHEFDGAYRPQTPDIPNQWKSARPKVRPHFEKLADVFRTIHEVKIIQAPQDFERRRAGHGVPPNVPPKPPGPGESP
jgi:hypothetical protein